MGQFKTQMPYRQPIYIKNNVFKDLKIARNIMGLKKKVTQISYLSYSYLLFTPKNKNPLIVLDLKFLLSHSQENFFG